MQPRSGRTELCITAELINEFLGLECLVFLRNRIVDVDARKAAAQDEPNSVNVGPFLRWEVSR